MKRLYVSNLSYSTTEDELEELFSEAGEIVSVTILTDRDTGRSRGFGFIEFETEAQAQEARTRFNGVELGGRNLRVDVARERDSSRSRY